MRSEIMFVVTEVRGRLVLRDEREEVVTER